MRTGSAGRVLCGTVMVLVLGLAGCSGAGSTAASGPGGSTAAGSSASAAPSSAASPGETAGETVGGSPAPSPTVSPQAPAYTAPAASTVPRPTPTPSRTSRPAATTQPPSTRPTIILEPDGLGFLVGPSSIQHLTFAGSSASAITLALTAALGPLKITNMPECGQGPRISASRNGFSVVLDGKKFSGWLEQGAPGRRLTTANGLGLGATLAQVRKLEGEVTVDTATLGPEFFQENGISGFLDGSKSTSKVTALYAGETCFFR